MQAVIVEDEQNSAELLAHLIVKHCPAIHNVQVFTNSLIALDDIKKEEVDILFCDIEMPHLNGFELINRLSPLNAHVIFTTAYDKYAVRAFKFSALDYLLKPIDISELKSAVQRAVDTPPPKQEQMTLFKDLQFSKTGLPDRIAVSTMEGLEFLQPNQVIYCQSEGSYTHLILMNNKRIVVSRHLKEIEKLLQNWEFYRIHHSFLINLKHLTHYIRSEGGEVVMSDQSRLPVARNRKEAFLEQVVKL